MNYFQRLLVLKELELKKILIFLLVFVFLLCIYLFKVKMYLFDTDDWIILAHKKSFLPEWGSYNPAKVLPETLMPIITYIGYWFLYPFNNDLVISSYIVYSVFLSFVVSIFILHLINLTKAKSKLTNALLSFFVLFILASFCYKNGNNSVFLLSTFNVTCIFNYTIPNILNCVAVIYLMSVGYSFNYKLQSKWKTAFQAFALYYVIFSNLYSNVILVSFSCAVLLQNIIFKNPFKSKALIPLIPHFYVVSLWLISAIYEYNGGRSKEIETNFSDYIVQSIEYIGIAYKTVNFAILIVFISTVLLALITIYIRKKNDQFTKVALERVKTCLIACFGLIVYIWLLASKTSPGYIVTSSVRLALYFYPLLVFILLLSVLMRFYLKSVITIIALTTMYLMYQFISSISSIQYCNSPNIDPEIAHKVILDMQNQLFDQANNGQTSFIIQVPIFKNNLNDNFPLALYGARSFARTFYRYGKLPKNIEAKFVINYDKNVQFGLEKYAR